ncbi:MAG: threonine-phosphate decarboxylase [Candidatus Competibacteraceae bacterium]|nr:threonine-phosphate decarboxylase [Candidatus Competibacteraceae bacterium]
MLEHGGGVRAAASRYGIALPDWLDVSTGINPRGWPVPTIPATVWQRLPEAEDGLENMAAAYYQTANVLAVAGSQAAIQRLPLLRDLSSVGVASPTYAEHVHAWRRAGHRVEPVAADELDRALDRLNVVVVVNPNNPTGVRYSSEVLLGWRKRLAARGGWLVVDEAFMDATPAESLANQAGLPGLIVLRSLGKFFGLAGARVGFVLAEPALLARLADQLGPWPLANASRWLASRALGDRCWQGEARIQLAKASQRLAHLLEEHGLAVAGGTALFQWAPVAQADFWQDALARQGILVRCFADPPSLRFGLPGPESAWQRLERALVGIQAGRLRQL